MVAGLGIAARADQSGLAQLSEHAIKKLEPDRILIVSLGMQNRGTFNPHAYDAPGRQVYQVEHPNGWSSANLSGFLGGLKHLFSFETHYDVELVGNARSYGVRTHLFAMPELYNLRSPELVSDHVWLPTALDESPRGEKRIKAQVLPWWCPTDEVPARHYYNDRPVRFVHVTGVAMADRNGTKSVIAACAQCQVESELVIVGAEPDFPNDPHTFTRVGKVNVRRITRVDHWKDWLALGDVLVLPRRFGWLSLPMFEAAASGMPVITTDLWPQNDWFSPFSKLLVGLAGNPYGVNMKGGSTLVYTAHPLLLASAMDFLAADPGRVRTYGTAFRAWAEQHDWNSVRARWRSAFT